MSEALTETVRPGRIDCVLVASGKFHDIDFARLELLKLLGEDERIRVRVFEDYSNLEAIRKAAFLVSYTCDPAVFIRLNSELRWIVVASSMFVPSSLPPTECGKTGIEHRNKIQKI